MRSDLLAMVDVRDLMVVSCEVDSRFPVASDRFEYVCRFFVD